MAQLVSKSKSGIPVVRSDKHAKTFHARLFLVQERGVSSATQLNFHEDLRLLD
jgi:hypothetical protein